MDVRIMVAYTVLYFITSLIVFYGLWKDMEDDNDIYRLPRGCRITLRLLVLLL